MSIVDEIRSALSFIPADDRSEWVQMAMAVKSELGNDGFGIWDEWSRSDDSYRAADARAVWRSIRPHGGVTIRSLFWLARANGWTPPKPNEAPVVMTPRRRSPSIDERAAEAELRRVRAEAAKRAAEIVQQCEAGPHPYLASKGFPEEIGLLDYDGRLVLPMRDVTNYRRIQSLQWIASDGTKMFLKNGAAKGGVFILGNGAEQWFCEGYATGLSLRMALDRLYRPARIFVCFSDHNLRYVAGLMTGRRFVMADNDPKGAGQRAAERTGLPWVMSPNVGQDANDYHRSAGIDALADLLREVRTS